MTAKVFLWVLCALALCGFAIYGFVMQALPRQYTVLVDARISQDFDRLTAELDGAGYAEASEQIYDFCIRHQTTAMLVTGAQTVLFGGEAAAESESTSSVSSALQFSDRRESSVLTVLSSASAAGEISDTVWRLLPPAAALVLLISALSAWVCSRVIVRPVLQISGVSERMAQLDMTWRCDGSRTDELGVLARSLNTLSERLTEAMGALEAANAQLKADVAAAQTLEKQRRDFFTAASHELKTPITILKGQLESMTLGIGDYRNHEKYLPQALEAVDRMERLIQEMLAILKMESGVPADAFAETEAAPVLYACAAEVEALAAGKGIAIDLRQVEEAVRVRLNRPLFSKAVSNLLSNAVRHSPPNQRVTVALTQEALTVENSGAAIAAEDLPFLFAPFYRGEKSRNRGSGGSGLGLYLVKTILNLHGFSCEIENRPNAVRVTVRFNQN